MNNNYNQSNELLGKTIVKNNGFRNRKDSMFIMTSFMTILKQLLLFEYILKNSS